MLFCLVGCNQTEKEPAGTDAPSVSTQEATEPQETEPASKPAETEPAETKPAETKPAETKPVEPTTPSHTHKWVAATCTAPKTCSECKVTEGIVKAHSWKSATCTAPKTCSECKATEGAAKGHSWKEATCTDAKTCSACKKTEGKALGHTWAAATCTTPKTCSVCKATNGKANGHKTSEWIVDKEATCTVNGSKHQSCSVCNATVNTETIKAAHKPGEWVTDAKATCDQDGSKHQVCSVCAATVKTEKISATGHDYVETVNHPTDTTGASIKYDCKECGYSYTKEIPPISVSAYMTGMSSSVGPWGSYYSYTYRVNASGGYGTFEYKYTSGSSIVQDWTTSSSITVTGRGILRVTVKDEIGQTAVYDIYLGS